jgi:hypothetical protein
MLDPLVAGAAAGTGSRNRPPAGSAMTGGEKHRAVAVMCGAAMMTY